MDDGRPPVTPTRFYIPSLPMNRSGTSFERLACDFLRLVSLSDRRFAVTLFPVLLWIGNLENLEMYKKNSRATPTTSPCPNGVVVVVPTSASEVLETTDAVVSSVVVPPLA